MRIPFAIREYKHLHRLLIPFFLHHSFSHLFISVLIQMLIGFNFEKIIGTFKLMLFWFLTVVGGHIFGALTTSDYVVGSDCYVFALFGGMIGIMVVMLCRRDSDRLPEEAQSRVRCAKICTVLSLCFLLGLCIIMMASQAANSKAYCVAFNLSCPDTFGSIGGFIFGFLIGLGLVQRSAQADPITASRERTMFWFSILTTVGLFILLFVLFFTIRPPTQHWYFKDENTTLVVQFGSTPIANDPNVGPMFSKVGGQ